MPLSKNRQSISQQSDRSYTTSLTSNLGMHNNIAPGSLPIATYQAFQAQGQTQIPTLNFQPHYNLRQATINAESSVLYAKVLKDK